MNVIALLILFFCGAAVAFNRLFGRSYHEELDREVERHEKEAASG